MYLPYVAEASPTPLEAPPTGPPLIIMPPGKMKTTDMNSGFAIIFYIFDVLFMRKK